MNAIGLNGSIEIRTNGVEVDQIRVISMNGSLVDMSKNRMGTFYLGNNLTPGVYIVEFASAGKLVQQKVIVK